MPAVTSPVSIEPLKVPKEWQVSSGAVFWNVDIDNRQVSCIGCSTAKRANRSPDDKSRMGWLFRQYVIATTSFPESLRVLEWHGTLISRSAVNIDHLSILKREVNTLIVISPTMHKW
jgi:hypothetical protein